MSVRHTHLTLDLNGSYLANPVVPVGPLLDPFPSWAANTEGDSDALQSVLGFEIDPEDRIWILDQVRMATAQQLVSLVMALRLCAIFVSILNRLPQGQGCRCRRSAWLDQIGDLRLHKRRSDPDVSVPARSGKSEQQLSE